MATTTATATATAAALTGYGITAGARADLMPNGTEREAMRTAAREAHTLAQALERGEHYTPEQFGQAAREIDGHMTQAGSRSLPERAAGWLALFTG
ncbi:hypothetical protein ACFWXA_13335 [Streptomyces atroolivaceus]|uniref:hypothetical protein n=1 Tax=Streptomyces atroolivaceus TaxID=66869 RepID=UPI0036495F8C